MEDVPVTLVIQMLDLLRKNQQKLIYQVGMINVIIQEKDGLMENYQKKINGLTKMVMFIKDTKKKQKIKQRLWMLIMEE